MTTPNPTEGELAILRILWLRKAPLTVREVHETLSRSKSTAYTTVLKMLTIMADKGLVRRDDSERSHTYVPVDARTRRAGFAAQGSDAARFLWIGADAGPARAGR